MTTPLEQLGEMGQSPWCDSISRHFIASSALQDLIDRGIRGVTVNPTIFEKAFVGCGEYDLASTKRFKNTSPQARHNGNSAPTGLVDSGGTVCLHVCAGSG